LKVPNLKIVIRELDTWIVWTLDLQGRRDQDRDEVPKAAPVASIWLL
jgi:hypothetical protein